MGGCLVWAVRILTAGSKNSEFTPQLHKKSSYIRVHIGLHEDCAHS